MLYVSGKNINTFRSNQTKVCHTITYAIPLHAKVNGLSTC